MNADQITMAAAIEIHKDILEDDNFAGYNGDKESFDRLYQEASAILRTEVADDLRDVSKVNWTVEFWYDFQFEISMGERIADWYLYV